jgi:hypothetical protein
MAHYAFLSNDGTNTVTEVIVGRDENEGVDWEQHYAAVRGQRCVRTSYNGRIRGVYAGIGYRYDEQADVFVPPSAEGAETASVP